MMNNNQEDEKRSSTHVFSNEELSAIREASKKKEETKVFSNEELDEIREASKKENDSSE